MPVLLVQVFLKNPAQALTGASGNIREAREVSGFSIPITFCVLIS